VQADALSGAWERDLNADLDVIARWNAAAVVTLVERHELDALQISKIGREVRRRHMEWHHWPIPDESTPSAEFEQSWAANGERIRSLLRSGSKVLIHCKGGLGRAGMVSARLLVELGMDPKQAIKAVRKARPGAIGTVAQERWVKVGPNHTIAHIDRGPLSDRALGALLGLAVGDAVGTTLEFRSKPTYAMIADMVGGGPFDLKVGQWTDDTAMALALADSLVAHPDLDPTDLMSRFLDWRENGTYSCTGTCFDCGNTVSAALNRFRSTREPIAGSVDAATAGNGALMRLSPVAIRFWNRDRSLVAAAVLQTRTTHGASEAVDASILFARILADAIGGASQEQVLSSRKGEFGEKIADIASGKSWRGVHRDHIQGSGYVVDCLNAAMWAICRTTDFRSAVLLAANLGQDADTTAAVVGQLAGALYGASSIPDEWLSRLAWRERLEKVAQDLFLLSSRSMGATAGLDLMDD
jgi:ADP-ribosyl-[dinitrogen reductase] hydrolase